MNIHGRIAVVSGGSSGIGKGTARALARRGAHVVLLARNEDELSKAATEIQGGQVSFYSVDVTLYASSTVRTSYFDHNPGVSPKVFQGAPFIPILSADEVGEAIVKAIEKKQRVLILPPLMNALVRLNTFFPGLVESMLRTTFMPKSLFGNHLTEPQNGRPQGD